MNSLLTALSLNPGTITQGADLARILITTIDNARVSIKDGDVIAIDHKLVAIALHGTTSGAGAEEFAQAIRDHSRETIAARTYGYPPSTMRLVRTPHNTVELNAGISVTNGTLILPLDDPQASAEKLHDTFRREYGVRMGLVLTTSLPHPFRHGQRPAALASVGIESQRTADEIASAASLTDISMGLAVIRGTDAGMTNEAIDHDTLGPFADWFAHGSAESVYLAMGIDPQKTPALSGDDTDDILTKVTRAISAVRLGTPRTPGENAWRIRPAGSGSRIEIDPANIELTSHAGGHPMMKATVGLGALIDRLTTALAIENLDVSVDYVWGERGTTEGAHVDVSFRGAS